MKNYNLFSVNGLPDSRISSEIRRLEEARNTWVKNLQPLALSEQLRLVNKPTLAVATMIEELRLTEQLLPAHISSILDPIADIRNSLMLDASYKSLISKIERPSFIGLELERLAREASHYGHAAKAMYESLQTSYYHAQEMFVTSSITERLAQVMKGFQDVGRQWYVPTELVDTIGALTAMQEQLGKLTLPVVDLPSAITLAKILGPLGIEAQLAALGIAPDGSLNEEALAPDEAGIGLSRKSLELMALLSFILTVLVPIYQELSSHEWLGQTDEKIETQSHILQTQSKQIESLSSLVEKALVQEAKRNDQRFVVLERIAIVRHRAEHGATVEGKLLPREVVKLVSEKGKWIEIEYYHWLLQCYQTGWALKKYFKRVPSSYQESVESKS